MKRREMTRKEMMREIRECWREVPEGSYIEKVYEAVFDVLKQEPCEDAISRKKVIDTIYRECSGENLDIDFAKVLLLQRKIKDLQSVQPKVKTGHWIDTDNYYQRWKCSECGCHTRDAAPPFCPNCGAKMEGSEDKE